MAESCSSPLPHPTQTCLVESEDSLVESKGVFLYKWNVVNGNLFYFPLLLNHWLLIYHQEVLIRRRGMNLRFASYNFS